jgi:hypothetical protein
MPEPVLWFGAVETVADEVGHHTVDIDALIRSKLLITGGSGSGKSRALRSMLEQLQGRVQQIVFDFEGDLVTLASVGDYLIAGDGGHVPAHPRQAAALADRVMAIGASIICNLHELSIPDRQAFVRAFLTRMMATPREQWRPCIVAIDEVQLVCPERTEGNPESADAVVDLAARGRKRGFCLVVTSQRIAKVRKDLVAECHNRLFGFISLPKDLEAAAGELGFAPKDRALLKQLPPGEFFAIGPAIAREVVRVRSAVPATREPESGTAPPPAPASLQALLHRLGELPPVEPDEPTSEEELRAELRRVKAELASTRIVHLERERAEIELRERTAATARQVALLDRLIERLQREREQLTMVAFVVQRADELPLDPDDLPHGRVEYCEPEDAAPAPAPTYPVAGEQLVMVKSSAVGKTTYTPVALAEPQRRMIDALGELASIGVTATRQQLALWIGVSHTTGSFKNNLSRLRVAGVLVDVDRTTVALTPAGRDLVRASLATPKSRAELHARWRAKLAGPAAKMLDALLEVYPVALTRTALAERLGVSHTTGSFKNNLSRLRTLGLVVDFDRVTVGAAPLLFPKGLRS